MARSTRSDLACRQSLRTFFFSAAALGCLGLLAGCGSGGQTSGKPPADQDLAAGQACVTTVPGATAVVGSGQSGDASAPEPSSGYRSGMQASHSGQHMVVTASPLASVVGCQVLNAGGNAVDAAVAVQMVLGLVEPQSSGIGGGAFMLYYDAAKQQVSAYDGRETAPAAATANYLRWADQGSEAGGAPLPNARASGRSIGTPGLVRMLGMVHDEHGSQQWGNLLAPAIGLADDGFAMPGRMADAIANAREQLARDPDAAAVFLDAAGNAPAGGTHFANPQYAQTLRTLASEGPGAFYSGPIARAIVDKIALDASAVDGSPITPGLTTLDDLSGYQAVRREAVCTSYRQRYMVCGMPPPSSGGIAVASLLGIVENFDLAAHRPAAMDGEGGVPAAQAVHWIAEASRLAYADRDAYIADTDFVSLPGGSWSAMLDRNYLAGRAALISNNKSMGVAEPGRFGEPAPAAVPVLEAGTSHVSIVDAQGNAVSLTTTVEASMGSFHVTRGFVLNNQLTDFSASPVGADGSAVANRVEAGKRPRSSMAPTLVFDRNADGSMGPLRMVVGSPGGGTIIQYVGKVLIGVLDWGMDAQQATNMVNFGASNSPVTNYGGEHPNVQAGNDGAADPVVQALRGWGHTVNLNAQTSGISTILRVERDGAAGWQGGADPRREGIALGDHTWPQ